MSAPEEQWDRLARTAEQAARELEGAHPLDVLRWASDTFGDGLCVSSSMTDAVLAHLAGQARPGVPVYFLDTGYHFAETIGTRDAIAATLPVNVITVEPRLSVDEQDTFHGKDLFNSDPDRCCFMRKVEPLIRGLAGYDAWATGLRREETRSRVIAPVVGWDDQKQKVKVSPLARWTQDDVDRYITEHDVLVNPLQYDGYPSIGCWPCTRRVAPGDDPRSGRWSGFAKTECGIHTDGRSAS